MHTAIVPSRAASMKSPVRHHLRPSLWSLRGALPRLRAALLCLALLLPFLVWRAVRAAVNNDALAGERLHQRGFKGRGPGVRKARGAGAGGLRGASEGDLPGARYCDRPEYLGDDYGGWTICTNGGSVAGGLVYTIGIGKNIEWDKAMISKFGTRHHGFDPTPSAAEFFAKKPPPTGFVFHTQGLGVEDGEVQLKLPVGNIDSYTILGYKAKTQAGEGGKDKVITIPVLTVESMLKQNNHTELAVLKIDVEGIEFAVIADWAARGYSPPANQVLFEFHKRYFTNETTPGGISPNLLVPRAIKQLSSVGFELMHQQQWEYAFVRRPDYAPSEA